MALTRIGTSRDVVAFTLTGSSGFRNVNGPGQVWAEPQKTAVAIAPGRYLVEGPPTVTQYNAAPWSREGDLSLPVVVEYAVAKNIYSAHDGVLKITRL